MTNLLPSGWDQLTNLGAAGLMVPLLLVVCAALWQSGQGAAAGRWLLLVVAASLLVLITKFAFLIWGLGSAALDFTGISGHATLATAILPLWIGWLLGRRGGRRVLPLALLLGLGIGALVAWSRVAVGAHSVSESVIGWLLGALIVVFAFRRLDQRVPPPLLAKGAGLILLLALSPLTANVNANVPSTHHWERRIALALSPTGVLHERAELRVPSRG